MQYLIKYSYDGTNFSGFQKQKNLRTIQEEIETALTSINNNKEVKITSSGRTDKKVHALCQISNFKLDVSIKEYNLKRALNTKLPEDIHVIETKKIDDKFNSRYNSKEKTYKYLINLGEYSPINRNYQYQYCYKLNVEKMKEAIKVFEGEHDFRAFVTENKEKTNCIRNIYSTNIVEKDNILEITFTGNGFLRYQVRNMVGILIRVGENKITKEQVQEILKSKDRSKSGKTAPPEGLYLVKIKY